MMARPRPLGLGTLVLVYQMNPLIPEHREKVRNTMRMILDEEETRAVTGCDACHIQVIPWHSLFTGHIFDR
jgi:hypothetical protein